MKTIEHFKPIVWITIGAVISLFIICPFAISLTLYFGSNYSKPLEEVIISTYRYFLWQIDFERSISDIIFLMVGGIFGYLFYAQIIAKKNKG
ncbi:MAG: hypothetical protein IPJ53_13300 [Saprospiraceae bacterium]|nr:hypothetical protein [Candidatus Vicinibacter affinis]